MSRLSIARQAVVAAVWTGLKAVPGPIGTAADFLQTFSNGLGQARLAEEQRALRAELTAFERNTRGAAEQALREVLGQLSAPMNGPDNVGTLVRELRSFGEQGYRPTLFELVFQHNHYFEDLKRNPHHYGRVLEPGDAIHRDKAPVFLEADGTRVLELSPFALHKLLEGQGAPPPSRMAGVRALLERLDQLTTGGLELAHQRLLMLEPHRRGRVACRPRTGRRAEAGLRRPALRSGPARRSGGGGASRSSGRTCRARCRARDGRRP